MLLLYVSLWNYYYMANKVMGSLGKETKTNPVDQDLVFSSYHPFPCHIINCPKWTLQHVTVLFIYLFIFKEFSNTEISS